ncbi:MAG: DUF4214 domain-containing protein [Coleofasciculus sp. S288]|nr:DUF4214 domain-containing protein [Coleofasciculus sp. S288]
MRFRISAITALLIPLVVISPAQAQIRCWFADALLHCWNEDNAWRDRYNTRDSGDRWWYKNNLHNEINQLYREVLNREVDSSGLETYSEKVQKGKSLEWVRDDLAGSHEAKNIIRLIYQEILGRDVDPSGLKTYTKRLRRGWSMKEVRLDISDSREAHHRRQYVSNLPKV